MADETKPAATAEAKPAAAPKPVLSANELQATQVKLLTPEERKAADEAHAKAKKTADEEHHASRIKTAHEHYKLLADKLYIGNREVTIERKAEHDDIGYNDMLACSVVKFTDTGELRVVLDSTIQTQRTA